MTQVRFWVSNNCLSMTMPRVTLWVWMMACLLLINIFLSKTGICYQISVWVWWLAWLLLKRSHLYSSRFCGHFFPHPGSSRCTFDYRVSELLSEHNRPWISWLIIESGASVCITPHRSEFITCKMSNMKIKDLSSLNTVTGEGLLRWSVEDLARCVINLCLPWVPGRFPYWVLKYFFWYLVFGIWLPYYSNNTQNWSVFGKWIGSQCTFMSTKLPSAHTFSSGW